MEPFAITNNIQAIMTAFAERTGLSNQARPPRRYLWTDAFAVCNFLTLYRRSGEEGYRRFALDLVDQVHSVLGRHREDDPRRGWISGLDEIKGARHPTVGGLRIGKPLNERQANEPHSDFLEWDRDGQYFHYLTKWMHALARVGTVTGEPRYLRWAMELAKAAHTAFAHGPANGGVKRMYWKMSIDLSRPLVPSMGLHDPLDAFVTYNELCYCARKHPDDHRLLDMDERISDAAAMCEGMDFTTDDPLGIGGLLFDACRLARMIATNGLEAQELLGLLLRSSRRGLQSFLHGNPLRDRVEHRLAFRELGLSIGLRSIERIRELIQNNRALFNEGLGREIGNLAAYEVLIETIERFWCDPTNQESRSWRAHGDINMVMLATSLGPDEFLSL